MIASTENDRTHEHTGAKSDSLEALERAWSRTDALFDLVREASLHERPRELRRPLVFHLGHLPAFASHRLVRPVLERESPRPEFDALFGAEEVAPDRVWPAVRDVLRYRDGVRDALRSGASELTSKGDEAARAALREVLEHELAHHELLVNLVHELDLRHKRRPGWWSAPRRGDARVEAELVDLGDCQLASTPVTVAEFEAFVDADGYEDAALWTADDQAWREERGVTLPRDWVVRNGRRYVRTMFDRIPLEEVRGWPVGVSVAEARAYCRWKGARLPSEHELAAAARTVRDEGGNLGFRHGSPTPVGSFAPADERVHDLFGNGWDWVETDGSPALFGGSWATDEALVRADRATRTAEGHPLPFAQFRLVR